MRRGGQPPRRGPDHVRFIVEIKRTECCDTIWISREEPADVLEVLLDEVDEATVPTAQTAVEETGRAGFRKLGDVRIKPRRSSREHVSYPRPTGPEHPGQQQEVARVRSKALPRQDVVR